MATTFLFAHSRDWGGGGIQAAASAAEQKVLDIWILLVLHGMAAHKRSVESLFRKKATPSPLTTRALLTGGWWRLLVAGGGWAQVLAGHFTPELVTHAVAGHGHTLRGCFPSLLGLADYLLRASEPAIRRHGGLLYVLAFRHFPDTYHRQEVLGALVAHIGSGSPHEVDGTLDVFERLAHQASGCAHLAVHASFIQATPPPRPMTPSPPARHGHVRAWARS